ncbi:MAG: PAS domain S-box protein [Desulfobacterales bacterium]|nr:PAS domain S-box protein [Desulfobacterales bacterium]
MKAMSEASFEAIFISEKGVCLEQNLAAEKMFGYTHAEIVGKPGTELIVPENREQVMNNMLSGNEKPYEVTALRKDGTIFPCEIHGKMTEYQGRSFRVTALRDITERKQAEDTIKYGKLQLESIFNNLDSSIYIADMKSYEILLMNQHMKNEFGKDLTGKICWQVLHNNQDGPCDFCTNDKLTDADGISGKPYIWEFYNQKLQQWYELRDQAIPWLNGRLVRMEIATDITERKMIDRKLKELNEELEQRVKERTSSLEDLNTALRVLLKKREEDENRIGENIYANFKSLIQPLLNQLKNSLTKNTQEDILDILESSIREMVTPFSKKMADPIVGLTPTEIQIAALVKDGKTNKEITQILNKSIRAVTSHRNNIRQKLGLKNKKINLRTYLLSLN